MGVVIISIFGYLFLLYQEVLILQQEIIMSIKLFVKVDLHSENDDPNIHTFCFNYGENSFENFARAAQDYWFNTNPRHAYIELNVDGVAVYGEDVEKIFQSEHPDTALRAFFDLHFPQLTLTTTPINSGNPHGLNVETLVNTG